MNLIVLMQRKLINSNTLKKNPRAYIQRINELFKHQLRCTY